MVKEKTLKEGSRAVTTYTLNFKQNGDNLHSRFKTCVELSLTSSISGANGAQLMQKGMANVGSKAALPQSAAVQKFTKVKIDYATLRPYEVLTRTSATIVQDQKSVDAVEEHEYFFDWPL
jgi:hypothetical protein